MTTKKSTKRIALLTALVLITSLFLGISVARYVTNVGSEDEARVAIWGIEGETVTMELFNSKYDANGNRIAESNDGDNIIAPGTGRSSAFSIMDVNSTIAPEVMYEIGINLDDSEIAPEILANPSIQWKLDANDWGTWEECKEDILNLTGSTGGKKIYAPNTLPDSFADGQEHTIAWQWLMDNGTDEEDTAMGNAAVRGDLKATIKVGVTAKQVDVDSTGMIEGTEQTFDINNPEPLVFKSIAPLSELQSVKVGTTTLTEGEHYTKADGSTVITLKESFLSTLKEGRHVISIVSTSMTAKASFEITKNQTSQVGTTIHSGIIPEGGTYYRASNTENIYTYVGDTSIFDVVYNAGEEFPETIEIGDTYVYGDYWYRYGYGNNISGDQFIYPEDTYWQVLATSRADKDYSNSKILTNINGLDVTYMGPYTFMYIEVEKAPVIPETITDIDGLFEYTNWNPNEQFDTVVSGSIEINATNLQNYRNALKGTNITEVTGTISDELKEAILATK